MYVAVKVIVVALLISAEAKKFTECELAKELLNKDFKKTVVPKWVCLITVVNSGMKTDLRIEDKTDPSISYNGLFQFSSKLHCSVERRGGLCNSFCASFLVDNITVAAKCAKKVHKDSKFSYWDKRSDWQNKCKKNKFKLNCPGVDV